MLYQCILQYYAVVRKEDHLPGIFLTTIAWNDGLNMYEAWCMNSSDKYLKE